MTALVLYELDPGVRAQFAFDDVAVPVRKDHAWEIFQGPKVHLDRLLIEIDAVIDGDPVLGRGYAQFLGRLARVAANEKAIAGAFAEALTLVDIGLRYVPGSLRLWLARAGALQALNRPREAAAAYRRVVWHPEFDGSALTLIMAARASLAAGEPASALEFLRRCPSDMLRDPGFKALVATCGGEVPSPDACTRCGYPSDEGFEFCPKCGTPVKRF